ncbi:MAG: transporter substrate-binding domain-containing protein [Legionella sp.]
MQGANHEIYGFDIEMINNICKIINRTCQFHVMRFDQLIEAVANKQIDAAVSSITITPERSKIVNFSLPYLLSYSRFLERQSSPKQPFNLGMLNGKKIGLETGTVFSEQLSAMGVKNPILKEYSSVENQLNALSNKEVDIILLNNATAIYWASNSSDTFRLAGPPYMYGYGYGIVLSPAEPGLLTLINQALVQYQNSDAYKQSQTAPAKQVA